MLLERPGLRWPLWSWRNLSVTCFAALAVLVAVGQMATGVQPMPAHPSTAVTGPAPRAESTSPAEGHASAPLLPPPRPAPSSRQAVEGFLSVWVAAGGRASRSRLAPYATARLLDTLQGRGAAQLPVTQIYGLPTPGTKTSSWQDFAVRSDAGILSVRAVLYAGGWLVDQVSADDTVPTAEVPSIGPTRRGA